MADLSQRLHLPNLQLECLCFCCLCLVQSLPKALGTKAKRHLEVMFDWALPACLRFLRKELQEISPTEDAGLARGAMRIIEACLDDFKEGMW